jgi:hypothetical protein
MKNMKKAINSRSKRFSAFAFRDALALTLKHHFAFELSKPEKR